MSREWVPTDEEESRDIWRAQARAMLNAWAMAFPARAPIAWLPFDPDDIKGARDHLVVVDEVLAFEAEAYQDWLSQQK